MKQVHTLFHLKFDDNHNIYQAESAIQSKKLGLHLNKRKESK